MRHLQQPSKTSCGPTCVAMLAGVRVADVLARLKSVRRPSRIRRRTHHANVGEMTRLLARYRMRTGRRLQGWPDADTTALLRIAHARGSGWHWAVLHAGRVYDPADVSPCWLNEYADVDASRVSYYEVEEN